MPYKKYYIEYSVDARHSSGRIAYKIFIEGNDLEGAWRDRKMINRRSSGEITLDKVLFSEEIALSSSKKE